MRGGKGCEHRSSPEPGEQSQAQPGWGEMEEGVGAGPPPAGPTRAGGAESLSIVANAAAAKVGREVSV